VPISFGGRVRQDFPSAKLDDPLLRLLQNFDLCEQLMIDLRYRLMLMLCYIMMDDDKFFLAIGIHPVFIQPSSQINHHLDKLSLGKGCWVKFIRGIGVMTGGASVCHGHCMKMFSWKG